MILTSALVGLGLVLAAAPPTAADENARELAQEILTKGASLFDQRDAAAMAATYAENAQFSLVSRDKDTKLYKGDLHQGREDIKKFYNWIFEKRPAPAVSRNNVESAHFIGRDLLSIRGTFQLDVSETDSRPLTFIQVRTRQNDTWRILNLQVFLVSDDKESP